MMSTANVPQFVMKLREAAGLHHLPDTSTVVAMVCKFDQHSPFQFPPQLVISERAIPNCLPQKAMTDQ